MYGAGSSVAAGDVLVTIKAKYESVDAALKSLKNVDKAIVSINKKKISIDAQTSRRGVDKLGESLEITRRKALKFKETALVFRSLGATINRLNVNIGSATSALHNTGTGAKQTAAALTILAANYKKLRIQQEAYRKASRQLFYGVGESEAKSGPFLPKIETEISSLKGIATGKRSIHEINSALQQTSYLLEHAKEDTFHWKGLVDAQNALLKKQAELQDKISGKVKETAAAQEKVTKAAKETVAAKKASDPGAGSRSYFPPGVLQIPGAQSMLDKQGAGSLERAIQMAFRAQEAAGGAQYPAARALEDLLGPSGIDKVMTKVRAFGGSLDLATTDVKRSGTSFPGGTLKIPGAQRMLKEQGPGSLQAAISLSRSVQAETGMPAAEALRLMLDDMTYFGQKLKELGWSAQKVDDAFVKIGNAATGARGVGGGGGRRGVAERFEAIHGRPLPGGYGSRGFRNTRRGMRRTFGGKTAQNFLLGGGFPMLFGGGAGAVGGSLLGSGMSAMMGMPGAGFGLQIAGSAIGTMLEGSIRKTNELAEALSQVNMDHLLESGIRLTAEIQSQVELLEKQGKHAEARALMEAQVYKQTGASAGVYKNIERAVDVLGAGWADLSNSVGATLAILSAPFLVALGAIAVVVGGIFNVVNRILTGLGDIVGWFGQFVKEDVKKDWNEMWDRLDKSSEKAKANLIVMTAEMRKQTDLDKKIFNEVEKKKIQNPQTAKDRATNDLLEKKQRRWKLDDEINALREQHAEKFRGVEESEEAKAFNVALEARITQMEKQFDWQEKNRKATHDMAVAVEKLKNKHSELNTNDQIALERKIQELELNRKNTSQLQKQLRLENDLTKKERERQELIAAGKSTEKIDDQIRLLEAQIESTKLLTDKILAQNEAWKQVEQTIEQGVVNALEAAIMKTKSLGEIASDVFRQIGRIFLQFGVSQLMGGMNLFSPTPDRYAGQAGGISSLAPTPPPLPPIPNAEGGFYTSTTNALIAEAGESEYVIPESKMSSALNRYSQGIRGDSVLTGGGDHSVSETGGGTTSTGSSIDVRFSSERINNIEYVTMAQFQAGVMAAAEQGAKRGETQTLRRLQTSPSIRKKVGI